MERCSNRIVAVTSAQHLR